MKIFIASLLLLVLYSSCQKTPDTGLQERPTNLNGDSTLLWRLVYLDTTEVAPNDTIGYVEYKYDAQKRVVNQFEIDTPGDQKDTFAYVTYVYMGNDTLPAKSISLIKDGPQNTWRYDTVYYEFDNVGRIIRDSMLTSLKENDFAKKRTVIKELITYTSFGLTIKSESIINDLVTPSTINLLKMHRIYNTVNNNLVVKQQDTIAVSWQNTTNGDHFTGTVTAENSYAYDNHVNPEYKAVPVHYPFQCMFIPYYDPFTYLGFQQPVNLTVRYMKCQGGDGLSSYTGFAYEYNSKGLPVIVRYFDPFNTNDVSKNLLFYTN